MVVPRHTLLSAAILGVAALAPVAHGEIVYIDNPAAVFTGSWTSSNATSGYYGANYQHNAGVAGPTATYTPTLSTAGTWSVWARWTGGTNRTDNVGYTVNYDGGSQIVYVNQEINGGRWYKLGDYTFAAGTAGNVFLNTAGTTDVVIADAVAFSRGVSSVRPALTASAAFGSTTISTGNRPAARVIDGSGLDIQIEATHLGVSNGNDVNWMTAAGTPANAWFKIDLGSTQNLESMDVFNFTGTDSATNDRGVKNFDLYVSTVAAPSNNNFATNPEWQLVSANLLLNKSPVSANNSPDLINFAANGTLARWVAFDINSNYGDTQYVGLGEVRFYAVPEPMGLAALAVASFALLTRRRRH